MEQRVAEIEREGPKSIPVVSFSDIGENGQFPSTLADEIRNRGCCVVKNVVSAEQALKWKKAMLDYVHSHPDVTGFPEEKPTLWKVYWTPAQVEARSHPNMIKAQVAVSQLYTVGSSDVNIDLKSQAMYADRFRVREAGAVHALPEHLDNGSIERWEDLSYSACYEPIWDGRWEDYDAWDMTHRADAVTDLYGGPGACSVFRSIQGWLSMANNGPQKGTLQLLPDIKLSTAYMLLRPFFDDDGKLDMESTYFYGAEPGMGQVLKDDWHPALQMDKSVISVPEIQPGDYVFWHCDMVHKVEYEHRGSEDSSVAYIPVVPLTRYNVANMVEQRKAFLSGLPPPDFPVAAGTRTEADHEDRGSAENILSTEGRRMLGLEAFNVQEEGLTAAQRRIREYANKILGFTA
ncbi:putative duf1479-domain-containing protein [Lasiodiplodia theobromae]|nr:putative duf1479-domain-containing protein [Lasiodiplodia theobromae]